MANTPNSGVSEQLLASVARIVCAKLDLEDAVVSLRDGDKRIALERLAEAAGWIERAVFHLRKV